MENHQRKGDKRACITPAQILSRIHEVIQAGERMPGIVVFA
jgi:hypothetical protein